MRSSHRNVDEFGERRADELGAFAIRTSYAAPLSFDQPASTTTAQASPALQTVNQPASAPKPAPTAVATTPLVQSQSSNFFAAPSPATSPAPAPTPTNGADAGTTRSSAFGVSVHEATGDEDQVSSAARVTIPRSAPMTREGATGTTAVTSALATMTTKQKIIIAALLVAAIVAAYVHFSKKKKGRRAR